MDPIKRHEIPCDVLVAGGGVAGVCCAVSAARNGSRVVLCQDRPVLGGNASSEVRMHICGADGSDHRGEPLATETREGGLLEWIRVENSVRNPQRSASMMDLILYDLCRRQENLELMLNTRVVEPRVENGRIASALAERASTEERFEIRAKVFVDCTGDAGLAAAAGQPFRRGREGREAFGEAGAQETDDSLTLGSSLLFTARKLERPVPFTPPDWAHKYSREDFAHRPVPVDHFEYGYWWIEWGGQLDTIQDNERIRDELLAILLGVWDYIKNSGECDGANWALDWVGFLPGKRESRRLIGQHTLCEADVMEARAFEDGIAYGGWPLDVHVPTGLGSPDQPPNTFTHMDSVYEIPLRCCVSDTLSNLMFAGRNLSATHVGFSTTRVMATCGVVGEGVGTAAAYAVASGVDPRELPASAEALTQIRQRLLRDDAVILGEFNADPHDLARSAEVSASSEQPGGRAAEILSGQTRSLHGPRGARPQRVRAGTNRWMSDPAEPLPARLQLEWAEPVSARQLRLVFDTGLHRPLTMTHEDSFAEKMHYGRPQEETVRDYRIEARRGGAWRTLLEVRDNVHRLAVHDLAQPESFDALRIVVEATWGLDHARIAEVRVYDRQAW
jgi:glycine/D-amino acid oxidase-like deaminating enzyme